ncbi:MAG: hypothetical protein ACLQMU_07565 [Methanoregula sp.]|uniref:hypothetical protein n=2 Tax=Methanoregula sp. TaxID=2052170 RepID=UPI003BDB95C0
MLIMTPPASRKHILVISPGTDLPAILASALSDPGAVTHTVILAEGLLVTDRTGETTQERAAKVALRNGITRAHDLALSLGIPAEHRTLDPTTVDSVCSQVMDIAARHPGARFSFVLSGGTAPLALGLFRMAAWLDGDVYFASRKAVLKKLTVPKMPASALAANPNYEAILTLLHKKPAVPGVISGVPRDELFRAMADMYVPVRTLAGRAARPQMTRGNFGQFLATLVRWGLIAENVMPGREAIRLYTITPDGEFAFALYFSHAL